MVGAWVIAAGLLGSSPVVRGDLTVGAGGWSRLTFEDRRDLHGGAALLPQAELSLSAPDSTWVMRYAPQLLSDATSRKVESWQEVGLKGQVKWSPRLELAAELDAGYGRNEQLAKLDKGHPMDALDLLRPVIDHDLDASADLGGSYDASPLDRVDLSLGYFARGGLTHAARQVEPFQAGPELYLGYEHSLSPIETLGATFYGASTTAGSSKSSDGRLELAWGRSLSPTFRTRLTAGGSATTGGHDARAQLGPAGSIGLDWLWPERQGTGGLSLLAAYAPRMDPITGERGNRAELSAALTRALTAAWALRGWAGVAREPGVANFALGGGDLVFRDRGGWSLALEGEAVHQARGGDQQTFFRVFTRVAYALRDVL